MWKQISSRPDHDPCQVMIESDQERLISGAVVWPEAVLELNGERPIVNWGLYHNITILYDSLPVSS